ncbi:MAG: hypothetical protein ACLUFN_04660 [Eubacterium sp.]
MNFLDFKDFKLIINNHYSSNPNIKKITLKKEEDRYTAKLDLGCFYQYVVFFTDVDEESVFLKYKIDGYKNAFSIYDVMNLFNIEDYTICSFSNFFTEDSFNTILDVFDEVTDKYYSYIKSIGKDKTLQEKLTENLIYDLHLEMYDTDEADEKQEEINSLTRADVWGDSAYLYTELYKKPKHRSRLLRILNKNIECLSIYEKRLLDYLNSDGELPEIISLNYGKGYTYYFLKMLGLELLISFSVVSLFVFTFQFINFHGAYVPIENVHIIIIFALISVAFLFGAMVFILSKPIIKFVTPKQSRDWVLLKFESIKKEELDDKGILEKILLNISKVVVILIAVMCMFFAANDNIGFYDDYVKFTSDNSLKFVTADYENVDIYISLGYYDSDEEYIEKKSYVIVSDNYYYDLGEIDSNGKTEQKIKLIANKYNKQITEIKSVESLNIN